MSRLLRIVDTIHVITADPTKEKTSKNNLVRPWPPLPHRVSFLSLQPLEIQPTSAFAFARRFKLFLAPIHTLLHTARIVNKGVSRSRGLTSRGQCIPVQGHCQCTPTRIDRFMGADMGATSKKRWEKNWGKNLSQTQAASEIKVFNDP
ncbi:hypothetical protein Zmor_000671 [Zophobas morio]|uniref:Uncharacterized protein n=1 Tax=Zophobas morio TaxID=2755281 RepID=A0AA38IXT3_9CUCU|nr:hypothetical protein Zmor_000671 [Zophobas morio]